MAYFHVDADASACSANKTFIHIQARKSPTNQPEHKTFEQALPSLSLVCAAPQTAVERKSISHVEQVFFFERETSTCTSSSTAIQFVLD
jgi:hypothetical protein